LTVWHEVLLGIDINDLIGFTLNEVDLLGCRGTLNSLKAFTHGSVYF
jgi:hypothetical protein